MLWTGLAASPARANLCNSKVGQRAIDEAVALESEQFVRSSATDTANLLLGDRDYNARLIHCNRKRDSLGNNVEKTIPATHGFLGDLPPRYVKANFNYLSYEPGLRYGYEVRREKGTWKVKVPMRFHWPKVKKTAMIDIPIQLADELGLSALGGICHSLSTKYRNDNPKREVLSGYIVETDKGDEAKRNGARYAAACRVDRSLKVGPASDEPILDRLRRFWQSELRTAWNRPGFEVEPVIIGIDVTEGSQQQKLWDREKIVWELRLNMITYHRPSYKRWVFKFWTHMYVGLPVDVFAHELGHMLGLDDEYAEIKGVKDDCKLLYPADDHYLMCDATSTRDAHKSAKAVYPWLVTRRYEVATPIMCKESTDCPGGMFCAKNGLNQNACELLGGPCETCSSNAACQSGLTCEGSRCVNAGAAGLGDACCANKQCASGRCNGDELCECSSDTQCGSGNYCEEPAFSANSCEPQKADCESCSNAGECRGGQCSTSKCVTPGVLAIGATCCRDGHCQSGSCNSDGKCQCKTTSDCGANQYCDLGTLTIGKNTCVSTRAICSGCDADKQCGAGAECNGTIGFKKCIVPASLSVTATCCKDAQCRSGKCQSDQCVCTDDTHCPSGQKCKKPLVGKNHCE